jgi:hypothetical protein
MIFPAALLRGSSHVPAVVHGMEGRPENKTGGGK